ncbi:hypothetical protein RUND412_003470 [Rhizina undulata]
MLEVWTYCESRPLIAYREALRLTKHHRLYSWYTQGLFDRNPQCCQLYASKDRLSPLRARGAQRGEKQGRRLTWIDGPGAHLKSDPDVDHRVIHESSILEATGAWWNAGGQGGPRGVVGGGGESMR